VRPNRSNSNASASAIGGLRSSHRQRRIGNVDAEDLQTERGDVNRVLAGPAARIEHRSGDSAFGC
jgi:hypothetical protein